MNFNQLLKKLESSQTFLQFKKQNPDSELVAGFFILNFKDNQYTHSLDYKLNNQITTFTLQDDEFQLKQEPILDKSKKLEPINPDVKTELSDIKQLIENKLQKENQETQIEKVIAVLQANSGDIIWNLTIMCSGFKIFLAHINAETSKITKFETKTLFDFVRPSGKSTP